MLMSSSLKVCNQPSDLVGTSLRRAARSTQVLLVNGWDHAADMVEMEAIDTRRVDVFLADCGGILKALDVLDCLIPHSDGAA